MHYYSFNIKDYRKDTQHLKPMEHYIYRMLIDLYYMDEKPIPKITQWVMRRLMIEGEEYEIMLNNVLEDFFFECDDGFRHKRIDSEIGLYHANADKNRRNGAKGGRPRKDKPKNNPVGFQSDASGLPNETQVKGNQEPLTNNHKPSFNNNSETEFSVLDSIRDWQQPEVAEINAKLMLGYPPMQAVTDEQYEYQLSKFKNYYAEKEVAGSYIQTEARRKDMLAEWIKRDYQRNKQNYQGNNNANHQPVNSQHQQPKQSSADAYADSLDAAAAAYFASQSQ